MKENMNNKGFTLAELLIVVAIISVLVAVSIPVFTGKLENSREATDIANLRAAKAAAVTAYLSGDTIGSVSLKNMDTAQTLYYDAVDGMLVETKPSVGYGKGTTAEGDASNKFGSYTAATNAADKVIKITIATDGKVTLAWE